MYHNVEATLVWCILVVFALLGALAGQVAYVHYTNGLTQTTVTVTESTHKVDDSSAATGSYLWNGETRTTSFDAGLVHKGETLNFDVYPNGDLVLMSNLAGSPRSLFMLLCAGFLAFVSMILVLTGLFDPLVSRVERMVQARQRSKQGLSEASHAYH